MILDDMLRLNKIAANLCGHRGVRVQPSSGTYSVTHVRCMGWETEFNILSPSDQGSYQREAVTEAIGEKFAWSLCATSADETKWFIWDEHNQQHVTPELYSSNRDALFAAVLASVYRQ